MDFLKRKYYPKYYRKTSSIDPGEHLPLMRHISVEGEEDPVSGRSSWWNYCRFQRLLFGVGLIVALGGYYITYKLYSPHINVIHIEDAIENWIDIGDGKQIWYRTWGRPDGGVPILFVHGGPGQAVVDYNNGNKRFFDPERLFVVEVDQRGTGYSQPSVRDDYRNMKLYQDISIDMIANDYEIVRNFLGIQSWVVWGGSYGSTISLNYCMRFPQSCISLLLRGIYLDTKQELKEVYTQASFEGDERKSAQFDILLQVAQAEVDRTGEPPLDPNDDRQLLEIYERMIERGDKNAIWTWHTFENNLMEDDPKMQLDPQTIISSKLREAQSVAFFETRLWLHGTFEKPSNLLHRVDQLTGIPVWICQGKHDNVCPVQNAMHLVDALEKSDIPLQAYFLEANHEDTDPVMAACLKKIMNEFLEFHSDKY